MSLFEAARAADLDGVRAALAEGASAQDTDEQGFTPLHLAAMGANQGDTDDVAQILALLIEVGAPLEHPGLDGRTALYLAAEFSKGTAPVQVLLDAGADPDVRDSYDNHVTVNALDDDVRALLSSLTGVEAVPVPEEAPDRPLSLLGWRRLRTSVDAAFTALEGRGIVTSAGVGQNQDEGWDTVNEDAQRRAAAGSTPRGAVFYTRADRSRAKASGSLALAFGTHDDDGDPGEIATEVVTALRDAGLDARWDGDVDRRIEVSPA